MTEEQMTVCVGLRFMYVFIYSFIHLLLCISGTTAQSESPFNCALEILLLITSLLISYLLNVINN